MPSSSATLCSACRTVVRGAHECVSRAHVTTTLVCGAPCAGKNTYVQANARPGDLVVDFDAIIGALGGAGAHDQPETLKPFAFDARDAALARLWQGQHEVRRAWVILSAPTERERRPFRVQGCRIVMLVADRETLCERAATGRPQGWAGYIDNWLTEHDRNDVDQIIDTTGR